MSEREQLELRLRTWLDDDDAVTCVQEMLDAGWRPPSEVAAYEQALVEIQGLWHIASPLSVLRARDIARAALAPRTYVGSSDSNQEGEHGR